jgi:RNA polymerase subunit RPABC4/transcription elongation factor Spt4
MLQCQNCGQVNNQTSNFCRFCGTKFAPEQLSGGSNYEFSPPRPYSWKTDEFQISESKARKTQQVNFQQKQPPPPQFQPQNQPFQPPYAQPPQALAFHQQQNLADYRCPRCSSQLYPRFERKISQAGWITFAVLLVAFFPLFWIGLLIKEDVRVCPVCQLTISY